MQLNNESLGSLGDDVQTPAYARADTHCGIVHLGVGAFHRAHQAVTIDDLLASEPGWAITGVSLRAADTATALNPQHGLYTLLETGADGNRARVIGSLQQVLVAPQQGATLLQAMIDPAVRIVSITITEKGYCHTPATGMLDEQHADIVYDVTALREDRYPRSAVGWLVLALKHRRENDSGPFTVVSCDNLPANGQVARNVVLQLVHLIDEHLANWIAANVSFPCSMVDRIVPATTDADREQVRAITGVHDAWPVLAEPFSQWVLEDGFCNGRPSFENAGVQMVDDVEPFELMKLRMLNGSHSTLAYLGFLAGHETVADAMNGAGFRSLLSQMMSDEIMPGLSLPVSVDLPAYRDALLQRFDNPALQHQTAQIAMDGSQKIPQRLLATIENNLKCGRSIETLSLAVAGWMRYARAVDEKGARIDVRDPLAENLAHAANAGDAATVVAQFLSMRDVFPMSLAANQLFATTVTLALERLTNLGAAACVAQWR
jgi:fructuronate reductase